MELTTDYPDYVPVMTFATDRALRRQMAYAEAILQGMGYAGTHFALIGG